ncbi:MULTISPECIES: hypothetical protein [Paenarthrobacter]|uniref:DUF8175 domain-containing protein n=1 Tax=Paenarthrobacter ureafaciens TaxID=37931 RepID=A0AAX3EPF5_PAEUR|nr:MULTISPECIES: hypothetical protein [Paenarthrobacter]NKR13740.1 hypothetical protein [Arthrobacter sp. M5]NKR18253.1 hypothetical protein [Arthrobacter sp. M6]MDO5866959.1 hypothetical protein [Paenarthrobacter sp. SD-2]MDO5877996.1 hypothetical protein [Paenarthrobacter sp. SD-1]UYV95367.1 hypothetical protein NL395_22510 [Paenarthrobacter ureafaciens]
MTEPTVNEDQNPLTKPKFIISAVVVAIIVALGIILILIPKGGGTPTADPGTAGTNTPSAQPSATAAASVCGLPAGSQAKPATTPADTKWELIGKIAAPTSPKQYGPGKTAANGLRSCFAHSPTGALYAAANVVVLSSTGKARLVYEQLAVPSPERDALLNQADSQETSSVTAQIAGFQIRSYDADRAVIVVAAKGSNGALVSVPVPLQWHGGDWKVVVPATGSTGGGQISDLSGYITWSGV